MQGWVKCNVDAAYDALKGQGATAAVLRSGNGSFIAGKAQWYSEGMDALLMETNACRDGMIFAQMHGVSKLNLETDSEVLVSLWRSGKHQRSHIAPVVSEMEELRSGFVDFSLSYATRSCNRIAHSLAKQVMGEHRMAERQLAPTCIQHLVTEECKCHSFTCRTMKYRLP